MRRLFLFMVVFFYALTSVAEESSTSGAQESAPKSQSLEPPQIDHPLVQHGADPVLKLLEQVNPIKKPTPLLPNAKPDVATASNPILNMHKQRGNTKIAKTLNACMGLNVGVLSAVTLAVNIFKMVHARSLHPFLNLPEALAFGFFAAGGAFFVEYVMGVPSLETCEKIRQQLTSWLHIENGQVSATFADPHTGETIKVRCLAESDPSNTTTGIKVLEKTCTIIDSR